MKPSFEEKLAEFERTTLPGEWKSSLIENALSEPDQRKILSFPTIKKIGWGTLAACWVVIGFLHVTTLRDDATPAPVAKISAIEIPLLVEVHKSRVSEASGLNL